MLARAGFTDTRRAGELLGDEALRSVLEQGGGEDAEHLLAELGQVADPDLALLSLVRLIDSTAEPEPLHEVLGGPGPLRSRLLALLGGSAALADWLVAHPVAVQMLGSSPERLQMPYERVRRRLLTAAGADPDAEVPVADDPHSGALDSWRRAYRRELMLIAAEDLTATDAEDLQPAVSAA